MNGQEQQPPGGQQPSALGMPQNPAQSQGQQPAAPTGEGLRGIVASSAVQAQQQVASMVQQGIGVGGYSELNYYKWVTASDQEHRMNPQAGENLLWVLPQRDGEPHLGRPEASHWMQHLKRSFRCIASMFPEKQMRCPICDALQQMAHLPGVNVNRMGAQWRYNLCVVDSKNMATGVQVVTLSDKLFMQIYQMLANEGLPEADRDFTNPLHGRPWQIIRTMTNKGRTKYSAQIYPITPGPMVLLQDGTPDLNTIQYWIDSCPKLWEIITFPTDEMMTEIATVAYDLINYWTNRPQAGPAIGMPMQTQVPMGGMPAQQPQYPQQGTMPPAQPQQPASPVNPVTLAPPPPAETAPVPPGMGQQAASPVAGTPGAYTPSLVPPAQPQQPASAAPAPGTPGYMPSLASAPVAPGGAAPPGLGDQSPPPAMGMPGQPTPQPAAPIQPQQPQDAAVQPPQAAAQTGRTVCFAQFDSERIMCQQCKDRTECAEASPKTQG